MRNRRPSDGPPAEEPETSRRKAVDLARQALQVAENGPGILANAAQVLALFGEDFGAMLALIDRALALNPNYARGWHVNGILRGWAGQHDLAIKHVEKSLRLSPRVRIGTSFAVIGGALFANRRFDEAVPKLLVAIQEHPDYPLRIAISPPATHIWGVSTKQERLLRGSARVPLLSRRASPT